MKMDRQAWELELDAMRRAGLRTLVIQYLEFEGTSFMPPNDGGQAPDPTAIILDYADRNRMGVFVGLTTNNEWWRAAEDAAFLAKLSARSKELADAAWSRYGTHASFAGWYLPSEPSDSLAATAVPGMRKLFRGISDHCKRLSNGKRVTISPFLTGEAAPEAVERNYTDLLADAGIDIVMLQDGVGARGWDKAVEPKVRPLFRAMRDACLTTGVELWADVEVFRNVGTVEKPAFVPADTARIGRQLAVEAPFVSQFIAFDFFHYMSPHRGEKQKALHEAYLQQFVDRPFFPVQGRGVIVDPSFAYYRDRSVDSIAAEVRANGYSTVHCIADPSPHVNRKLVEAFHRAGIGVWLQVFGNGTYSKESLPPQWPAWRMVTRTDLQGGTLPGFQRLCLNNADYRTWKKRDLAASLRTAPFDAIEIAEPFWPDYPGVEAPAYGCFCESCRKAFRAMFPDETDLPDIINKDSRRSPANSPALWAKWLKFRQASMTAFLDDLVNGKGGLRQTSPGRVVSVWGLGLLGDGTVDRLRTDQGQDGGDIAATVKPDVYCIQTHWPDWMRADLPFDYVTGYKPFIEQVRQRAPGMPLMIQTDIGSNRDMIRDRAWVEEFESACTHLDVTSTCLYEYFIGGWSYHEPPRVVEATWRERTIELVCTRRIDPASAERAGTFELESGRVEAVRVDGNVVRLTVSGIDRRSSTRVVVRGLADEPQRRLFPGAAASVQSQQTVICRRLGK